MNRLDSILKYISDMGPASTLSKSDAQELARSYRGLLSSVRQVYVGRDSDNCEVLCSHEFDSVWMVTRTDRDITYNEVTGKWSNNHSVTMSYPALRDCLIVARKLVHHG